MERDFLTTPERSEPENVHQGKYFYQLFFFCVWEQDKVDDNLLCVKYL